MNWVRAYKRFDKVELATEVLIVTHVGIEGELQFSLNCFLDSLTETRISRWPSALVAVLN